MSDPTFLELRFFGMCFFFWKWVSFGRWSILHFVFFRLLFIFCLFLLFNFLIFIQNFWFEFDLYLFTVKCCNIISYSINLLEYSIPAATLLATKKITWHSMWPQRGIIDPLVSKWLEKNPLTYIIPLFSFHCQILYQLSSIHGRLPYYT